MLYSPSLDGEGTGVQESRQIQVSLESGSPTQAAALTPRPRTSTRLRTLGAGPRARLFDLASTGLVLLGVLAGTAAVVAMAQREFAAALLAGVPLCVLGGLMVVQARRISCHRRLAREGVLVEGRIIESRRVFWSLAPRADSAWSRPALPFLPLLLVRYEFETEVGEFGDGVFLVSQSGRSRFAPGRPVEVFYSVRNPQKSAISLVLRWYFRLRGAA